MVHTANLLAKRGRFDPMIAVGFLLPIAFATLIGLAIYAHSKPIQMPESQTTNASGGVTATAPVSTPTATQVAAANAAILSYCENDLRQDTSCALIPNSDTTAPGFVESGLRMTGSFATSDTEGASPVGLALAKASGSSWSVVWVGQNCIPSDVASENAVPSSLNICSS
jgi:hypothetical protein